MKQKHLKQIINEAWQRYETHKRNKQKKLTDF